MSRVGRKRGLYYEEITNDVLSYVRSHPGCTAREIADRRGYSWVTVNRYLKMLRRKKLVRSHKRGRIMRWVKW